MRYPSKFGVSLIALSGMLYLAALQSRSGLLFLILGILFACYVLTFVESRRTAARLSVTPPESSTGVEGEPVKGTWLVRNESEHSVGLATVSSPWGVLFHIGVLAPQQTLHLTPELTFAERGAYNFAHLSLESGYPFGLIRCKRPLQVEGEIVVYPATYVCAPPPAAGFEPMVGGKFSGMNRSASGDRFHGVRPLQPYDPVKLIHWPSSSKGFGLMVREYDEELSGRVGLILDADTPDGGRLNQAVRAAASLMLAALDQGHQVEFLDLAQQQHLSVPPFSDGEVVLDRLARLSAVPGCLTCKNLEKAILQLPRKASVCLVLTWLEPEILDYVDQELGADKRTVALYLPGKPGDNKYKTLVNVQIHFYNENSIVS